MRGVKIIFLLAVAFLMSGVSFANNIYTHYLKRTQPDGTVLWVREWGDEFQMNRETKDGYSCDYNHETGYFQYTTRGEDGWLKLSPWKVGIDNPEAHSISKHESVSSSRQREIEERRKGFGRSMQRNSPDIPNGSSAKIASVTGEWEIDIVLVQFSDIKGDTTYTKSDFENMLKGSDYDDPGDHPESEDVFGSVKAYFTNISNGNFTLSDSSRVLNSTRGNDIPNWITVGYTKQQVIEM